MKLNFVECFEAQMKYSRTISKGCYGNSRSCRWTFCHIINTRWDMLILDEKWRLDVKFYVDGKSFFDAKWVVDDKCLLDDFLDEWKQPF